MFETMKTKTSKAIKAIKLKRRVSELKWTCFKCPSKKNYVQSLRNFHSKRETHQNSASVSCVALRLDLSLLRSAFSLPI